MTACSPNSAGCTGVPCVCKYRGDAHSTTRVLASRLLIKVELGKVAMRMAMS